MEATKAPLTKPHEALLINTIKSSPQIVLEWNPSDIPALVEYNYSVALEALCTLATQAKGSRYH